MSGALASQASEKLAFIHVFLYSVVDLGGVEWPPHINLRHISSSPSGGENPAKPFLERVSTPFGRAVGATMMAGAMIAAPMSAMANDAPKARITAEATVQTVSVSPSLTIEFLEEAQFPASAWVADHSDRVAVSVMWSANTPDHIMPNINSMTRELLSERGHDNVRIFWQHTDLPNTAIRLHSDKVGSNPIWIGWPREKVIEAFDDFSSAMKFDPVQKLASAPTSDLN